MAKTKVSRNPSGKREPIEKVTEEEMERTVLEKACPSHASIKVVVVVAAAAMLLSLPGRRT